MHVRPLLLIAALWLTTAGPARLSAQQVAAGPWAGGVTSDAATVVVRMFNSRLHTLEISRSPDFAQLSSTGALSARPGDQPEMARFRPGGLQPNTRYYYRVRTGNQRDSERTGSFRTMPLEDRPASFRFIFSASAAAGSEHAVFSEIRSADPLFYVVAGNLHDATVGAADRAAYRRGYESALASVVQADLYRWVPLVYTWDAFDYGIPGGAVPARAAAHATFREYVPHHALADSASPDSPVYRAFTVGRVRFLVLDVRSERGPAGTTLLGARQLDWLKAQLLEAKGRYPLVFVVSPASWLSPAASGRDDWSRYSEERAALSDWMVEQGVSGVCFLTGDGYVLAADDGSHNTYGERGGARFPVLQAGPLDRSRTTGAGPWSAGPVSPEPGEGFFGLVDVTDAEGRITVRFRGMNQHGRERLGFTFQVAAP